MSKKESVKLLSADEVNEYLGIDFADETSDRRIKSLITVADAFLEGAIGQDYPREDPRIKELALMIVGDLYDHRTLSAKQENSYRKLAHDFEWQIRLEMRNDE